MSIWEVSVSWSIYLHTAISEQSQSTACQTKAVYTPAERHAENQYISTLKSNACNPVSIYPYSDPAKMGLFKSRKSKHTNQSVSTSSAEHSPRQLSSPQSEPYNTNQRNLSASNLSTTSTLTDAPVDKPSRPAAPTGMTSYEAFMYHARLDAERSEARQKAQEHAWRVAAERRRESNMWPADPWRGGFGPRGNGGANICGGQSVEGWLRGNGLKK